MMCGIFDSFVMCYPHFALVVDWSQYIFHFLTIFQYFIPCAWYFFTLTCVELYDCKFRLLVWLWKPFQRCLNGKEYHIDFINVFASLFLLSITKVLQWKIQGRQDYHYFLGYTYVLGVDQTVLYGSTEHLLFVIPAAIIFNS